MSVTELIFWLAYIGGTVGALFRPVYGVLLYILVYNLNPETQWWGATVNMLGLRTSFTVAVAAGLGMFLNWRPMRDHESQVPLAFKFMIAFLFYAFLVSVTGLQPLGTTASQQVLIKLAKVFIYIAIMIRVLRTQQHMRWMVWVWLVGTIYIGFQAWSGIGLKLSGRLTGGLGGPDFSASGGLSAHMVMMMALAGYMVFASATWRGRLVALMAAGFAVNTVVLTRTRNAFPGIIVLIVFGMMQLPKGMRLRCFVGIVVGLLAALQLTDEGWWTRMRTMKEISTDRTITSRFDFWQAAADMARDHPFGVGVGYFRKRVREYIPHLEVGRSAHSTFFQCLAELGYPGLLLFISVIAATFWHFERARSLGKSWRDYEHSDPVRAKSLRDLLLMSTATEVALAGFLACSMFHTRMWTEGMWLLLAMGCCTHNVAGRIRQEMMPEERVDISAVVPELAVAPRRPRPALG